MTTTVDIYVNDIVVEVGVTGPGRKGDPGTTDYLELENRPDEDIAKGVEAYGWGNHADAGYAHMDELSPVATTGDYNDLDNTPILADVALSGDYNDLINLPTIPQGDMLSSVYDPSGKQNDVFSMENMVEGENNKIFSNAERNKLSGIEEGATQNASDASLRDRSTHTGEQPISSVTGLQEELDDKLENISNLIEAGEGISITGNGTSGSPYSIASVAHPSVVEERVGDSYTIVSSDLSKYLVFTEENNPISLIIPDDVTLDMGIGSTVTFVGREQEVVLTPSAGVTLESFYRYPTTIMYERSVFSLIKEGANTWRVVGFEKEEE